MHGHMDKKIDETERQIEKREREREIFIVLSTFIYFLPFFQSKEFFKTLNFRKYDTETGREGFRLCCGRGRDKRY